MTWFVCKRKDNVFGLFIGNTIFCFWNILVYNRLINSKPNNKNYENHHSIINKCFFFLINRFYF